MSRNKWNIGLLMCAAGSSLSRDCCLGTGPVSTSLPAEQMAKQWKEAVAKFDSPKAAMLKEVDVVGHEGPYRPDWGSLSKWDVPAWYKDAKVWHLHSLGRICGPGFRQRVVSAGDV